VHSFLSYTYFILKTMKIPTCFDFWEVIIRDCVHQVLNLAAHNTYRLLQISVSKWRVLCTSDLHVTADSTLLDFFYMIYKNLGVSSLEITFWQYYTRSDHLMYLLPVDNLSGIETCSDFRCFGKKKYNCIHIQIVNLFGELFQIA